VLKSDSNHFDGSALLELQPRAPCNRHPPWASVLSSACFSDTGYVSQVRAPTGTTGIHDPLQNTYGTSVCEKQASNSGSPAPGLMWSQFWVMCVCACVCGDSVSSRQLRQELCQSLSVSKRRYLRPGEWSVPMSYGFQRRPV